MEDVNQEEKANQEDGGKEKAKESFPPTAEQVREMQRKEMERRKDKKRKQAGRISEQTARERAMRRIEGLPPEEDKPPHSQDLSKGQRTTPFEPQRPIEGRTTLTGDSFRKAQDPAGKRRLTMAPTGRGSLGPARVSRRMQKKRSKVI